MKQLGKLARGEEPQLRPKRQTSAAAAANRAPRKTTDIDKSDKPGGLGLVPSLLSFAHIAYFTLRTDMIHMTHRASCVALGENKNPGGLGLGPVSSASSSSSSSTTSSWLGPLLESGLDQDHELQHAPAAADADGQPPAPPVPPDPPLGPRHDPESGRVYGPDGDYWGRVTIIRPGQASESISFYCSRHGCTVCKRVTASPCLEEILAWFSSGQSVPRGRTKTLQSHHKAKWPR